MLQGENLKNVLLFKLAQCLNWYIYVFLRCCYLGLNRNNIKNMPLAYFQVYGLDGAYWTLLVSVHYHSHQTSTQTPKGLHAFTDQEIASYSQVHRMVWKYKTNQLQVYFVIKSIMGMCFNSDLGDQIHTAWALVKISCTPLAERKQVSTHVLRLPKDHLDFYTLFTVTSKLVRKHFNQMCEISPANPTNVDR